VRAPSPVFLCSMHIWMRFLCFCREMLMRLQDLERFAAAQGMRVIEGESCVWVEKRKFFLESLPPHRRIQLRPGEAARLFLRGAGVIRYSCDEPEGAPSFEYVWDDKNYSLDSLHKDAKRNVRKNLDSCLVRRLDYSLLSDQGCAINRSVFARQARPTADCFLTNQALWNNYMQVCESLPFVEAYGAFIEDQLCAFCLVLLLDEYCYTYHPHASTRYLKHYPMNVLIFSIVRMMLARPGIQCVSYGLESFASRPTLERFKLAMGCRKRPIGRQVLVHPLARPLFSRPGAWLTQKILRRVKPGLVEDFAAFSHALRSPSPRAMVVQT
jgi:hypothetical protein